MDRINLYCKIVFLIAFVKQKLNSAANMTFCCTRKSRAIKNGAIFLFAFYLGEKLLLSDKYVMTEHPLNEYSWQMNLTVHSLEKRDFGGYVCSSVNALGKFDGVVRLQGTENSPILSKIVFCRLSSSSPVACF